MSKLLSDEELRQKMQDIFNDCTSGWLITIKNFNGYERELGDMESEIIGDILDLINTQKRLYAESVISGDDTVQNEGDTETFKHMLTVLMIMFGDAKECEDADRERSEKLTREAFEYAESWLEVFRAEQRARIK